MLSRPVWATLVGLAVLAGAAPATAQTFEVLGTRAAGMGGAAVAVADDASAVYWNPAGLALGGSYFSMVIDSSQGQPDPEADGRAGSRSANMIALSTLPLGLSYYRLGVTRLTPGPAAGDASSVRLERLVTHHAGFTIVQSVTRHVALATTLKLVHGVAAAGTVANGDIEDLLDEAGDLPDSSTNKFDADIGVMALFGTLRAGLTVRNITEPDFTTGGGQELIQLKRQTRAGISYRGVQQLVVAADVDIERARGLLGDVRNVAAGAEAHIMPRAFVRSGFRFNTLSDEPGGSAFVYSFGGSYVPTRSLIVDAQVTLGSESGDRGWGVAARLVY